MSSIKKINQLRLAAALKKFQDQILADPSGAKKLLTEAEYTADEAKQIIEAATAPAVEKPKAEAKPAKGDIMVKYHPEKDQYHHCTKAEHQHVIDTPGIELEKGWETIAEGVNMSEAVAKIDDHKAEVLKAKEKAEKAAAKKAEA